MRKITVNCAGFVCPSLYAISVIATLEHKFKDKHYCDIAMRRS